MLFTTGIILWFLTLIFKLRYIYIFIFVLDHSDEKTVGSIWPWWGQFQGSKDLYQPYPWKGAAVEDLLCGSSSQEVKSIFTEKLLTSCPHKQIDEVRWIDLSWPNWGSKWDLLWTFWIFLSASPEHSGCYHLSAAGSSFTLGWWWRYCEKNTFFDFSSTLNIIQLWLHGVKLQLMGVSARTGSLAIWHVGQS